MEIEYPADEKAERAVAIAKGAVSAVPIVGGMFAELGNVFLNPLERRKEQWGQAVSDSINEIVQRLSRLPDELAQDEGFVSILLQATEIAIRTHQEEKLHALRHAIVSSADVELADEHTRFQFVRFVDELSVLDLQLLTKLDKHSGQFARYDKLEQVWNRACELLHNKLDRSLFRASLRNLETRSLILLGDVDDLPEFASKRDAFVTEESGVRKVTVTKLGQAFLNFVSPSG